MRDGFRPTPSISMTLPGQCRRPGQPRTPRPRCPRDRQARGRAAAGRPRRRPTGRRGRRVTPNAVERPLRMIPCAARLDDDGLARRLEAGEQHAALHLGARDVRPVGDAVQRRAVDRQRRPPVVRLDRAPMSVSGSMTRRIGRRRSDASPTMIVRNGCARPGSRQQPHRGAGIGGVERTCRRRSGRAGRGRRSSTSAPRVCDRDAEGAQAGERGGAVGAGGVAGDMRESPSAMAPSSA